METDDDHEMENLKRDWQGVFKGLRAIRDDLEVRSHLATLELKDEWAKLKPRFEEAEQYATVISDATLGAARDLLRRAKELSDKLKGLKDQDPVRPH
ncbi:MAG: hypothetical protein QM723_08275 [Myxococcaceae bacterium]